MKKWCFSKRQGVDRRGIADIINLATRLQTSSRLLTAGVAGPLKREAKSLRPVASVGGSLTIRSMVIVVNCKPLREAGVGSPRAARRRLFAALGVRRWITRTGSRLSKSGRRIAGGIPAATSQIPQPQGKRKRVIWLLGAGGLVSNFEGFDPGSE